MPVVVRKTESKKPPSSTPEASSSSPAISVTREIPASAFVAIIVVVVIVVGVIAYRLFAPGETWDNTGEGSKPTASALSSPPPVARSGSGSEAGKDAQSQAPAGTELPPDGMQ